nr:hypothetical protein [Candidatus Sigynarchaeota archaeon]
MAKCDKFVNSQGRNREFLNRSKLGKKKHVKAPKLFPNLDKKVGH